jgi:hypothetical protein
MKDQDDGTWQRCRKTEDGGYKVTDDTVWDDILKEVNKDVMEMIEGGLEKKLLFIEFSRPNYVHSITGNFSRKITESALAVYLDVPFEICWERNVRRHERAVSEGTDDHLVSREEMEETYGSDDKLDLQDGLPMPVVFIRNNTSDEDDFAKMDEGVDMVMDMIDIEILKMKNRNENG